MHIPINYPINRLEKVMSNKELHNLFLLVINVIGKERFVSDLNGGKLEAVELFFLSVYAISIRDIMQDGYPSLAKIGDNLGRELDCNTVEFKPATYKIMAEMAPGIVNFILESVSEK